MRRALTVVFAMFVAFGATAAAASWGPGSTGSGRSTSSTVGVPTSVSATATSSTTIKVGWAAPATGPSPTQYVVRRVSPSTATVCTVATVGTCTDSGLAASTTYQYTVTSLLGASWTSSPSATASATTPAPATFIVALNPTGTKTAGKAFNVKLTATTNGTTTNPAYTGVKTITFSGPSNAPNGTSPTYPPTVTFAAGVGTASVKLYAAETPTLQATDGTLVGSTTVTVQAGTAKQLRFSSSTPSCATGSVVVGNGGSFVTKATAYDTWMNPRGGSNRTVTLARSPASGSWNPTSLSVTSANSETTSSATFTIPVGNPPDVTVTAAAGSLTNATCVVKKS